MAKYRYVISENTFINPYNFVELPLNDKERPKKDVSDGELSGVLKCELTAVTPIAVPDGELRSESEGVDNKYPFTRFEGKPFIPGGTIKGMLRNMYETLTDSCLVTMSDNEVLSKRTALSDGYKPGIVCREGGRWVFYTAKKIDISNSIYTIKSNDNVGRYIEVDNKEYTAGQAIKVLNTIGNRISEIEPDLDGENQYFVRIGEPNMGVNKASIFMKANKIDIDEKKLESAISGLDNTVMIYQDKAINRMLGVDGNTGYLNYNHSKRNGVICLWYRNYNGFFYLSMALTGRSAFEKRVGDLVGVDKVPCRHRDQMCPACRMFGMSRGEGFGSRLRISDAYTTDMSFESLGNVLLKPGGPPRSTYLPFYSFDGKKYDEPGARIRGRKFYWNVSEAATNPQVYSHDGEFGGGSVYMELAGINSKFFFDIYYEGLTEQELNQLKFVIKLPDVSDEKRELVHRIGHGKPLGLGAVKVRVLDDIRRNVYKDLKNLEDVDYNYMTFEAQDTTDYSKLPEDVVPSIYEQIRIICDLHALDGENVSYPYIELGEGEEEPYLENVLSAHRWYGANEGKGKFNAHNPKKLLAPITADISSQRLNSYIARKVTPEDEEEFRESVANKVQKSPNNEHEQNNYANIDKEYPKYEAVCIGRANNPRFSKAVLEDGREVSFFDENGVEPETRITLEYRGKSKKGNHIYILV